MPNRILRETILDSGSLDAVSPEAEVLFYRLLVASDDFGRMTAQPDALASRCFPLRRTLAAADVEARLLELHRAGVVALYEVAGKAYVQILKTEKPRAHKSKFPAPSEGKTLPADARMRPLASADVCTQPQTSAPYSLSDSDSLSDSRTSSPVVADATPAAEPPPLVLVATGPEWPADLAEVRKALETLEAPEDLHDPPFWRGIDEWLGKHPRIAYLDQLAKYLSWWRAQSGRKRHRKLKSGFRNWLATEETRDERATQRQHQLQQRLNEYPGANRR